MPDPTVDASTAHWMFVFGTRPEVIKLAPIVLHVRKKYPHLRHTLCSTGQHRGMLDSACAAFGIAPDVDLNLMKSGQQPADLLGNSIIRLNQTIADHKPSLVLVQGDTMSVTAGALAAFLNGVKVAHVEAGLRTANKYAPFPEEINRRVTSVVADYHFVPTATARENLIRENITPTTIFATGNTVIDALFWMRDRVRRDEAVASPATSASRRMIIVTAHRRESFGQSFRDLCLALRDIADAQADVELVYPVHLNPNVRAPVMELLADHERIRLIEPVDYREMVALLDACHLVVTDSGGLQEEAPALGKPVVVLRDTTERPEAVSCGAAVLAGTKRENIVTRVNEILNDAATYERMARAGSPYGDGLASQRICEILTNDRTR
ncbi:MAG: non-hydrolyzing UDP-N-acetylglucosamine 2-epimerase [Phycisphaerae bacterium]